MNRSRYKDTIEDMLGVLIGVILALALCAAIGHCDDTSPQNSREVTRLYIKHKNPRLPAEIRNHIAKVIIAQSIGSGIPYEIITAIMYVESSYNPGAIGPKGEIGLMQIYTMECGGNALDRTLLYVIEYNVAAGVCILLEKLNIADGDIIEAIRRYNGAGPSAERFKRKVCETILDIFRFRVANRNGRSRRRRLISARDW